MSASVHTLWHLWYWAGLAPWHDQVPLFAIPGWIRKVLLEQISIAWLFLSSLKVWFVSEVLLS